MTRVGVAFVRVLGGSSLCVCTRVLVCVCVCVHSFISCVLFVG